MNKKNNSWYKKSFIAQSARLNDEVDWFDDDTIENAHKTMNPRVVNFDELERQKAQNLPLEQEQGEVLTFTEDEVVGDLLVDNEEDNQFETSDERIEEGYFDGTYIPSTDELEQSGLEPVEDTGEVVDEEASELDADPETTLGEAIATNRVVKLSYLTLGRKRGRGGREYLKREMTDDRIPGTGRNIWRIVEPHDIFTAKNGHRILLTYDRSVRHVRAFRLDNVTGAEFTKNRITNEPSYFSPRKKIKITGIKGSEPLDQTGKIKGIESMNKNIFKSLQSVGDDLEAKGLSKTAGVITSTMSSLLNVKTAQYVGPQGYWIRNKRCWDNCYRQKRTTAPEKAAQVVWTECWEEYNKSINNNSSGWEKYAQEDADLFKYASTEQQDWVKSESLKFAKAVEKKMASGQDQGMSIYLTLEESQNKYNDIVLADADKLSKIAERLKENGQDELSVKMANVSIELLKESQFGANVDNWGNKLRKLNPFSAKSRAKGLSGDIVNRIKRITQQALQMANKFNTIKQQMHQSGKDDMAQQQQWAQQDQQQQANKAKRQEMMGNVGKGIADAGRSIGKGVNNLVDGAQTGYANLMNNSKSDSNIKTAAPTAQQANDPNYMIGAKNLIGTLKQEFQTFLANIRNEGAEMGQMATQEQDPQSQQRAQQMSQRILEFDTKASPFEQAFKSNNQMIAQSDALVAELQSLAKDVNMIQTGQYDPTAANTAPEGNVDPEEPASMDVGDERYDVNKDGVVNEGDDLNKDTVIDEKDVEIAPEQVAPQAPNAEFLANVKQTIDSGGALSEQDYATMLNYWKTIKDEFFETKQVADLWKGVSDAKSKATRTKNKADKQTTVEQPAVEPGTFPRISNSWNLQESKYGNAVLKNVLKK